MNNQGIQTMHQRLRDECIWLRICYNTFNSLFDSGDDVDELLRKSAGQFFADLNTILIEYYLLQVARITEPGKKKLTIGTLNGALRSAKMLTHEIETLTQSISSYHDKIVAARNNLVAHLNMNALRGGELLGAHHKVEMEQFMEDLQAYMDAVGNQLGTGPLDFRSVSGEGDVQDLINTLKTGQKVFTGART